MNKRILDFLTSINVDLEKLTYYTESTLTQLNPEEYPGLVFVKHYKFYQDNSLVFTLKYCIEHIDNTDYTIYSLLEDVDKVLKLALRENDTKSFLSHMVDKVLLIQETPKNPNMLRLYKLSLS